MNLSVASLKQLAGCSWPGVWRTPREPLASPGIQRLLDRPDQLDSPPGYRR